MIFWRLVLHLTVRGSYKKNNGKKKGESASTNSVHVKRLSTGIVGSSQILRNVALHVLSICGKDSFTVLKRIPQNCFQKMAQGKSEGFS